MNCCKPWLCALAVAIGCALPGQGFCDEPITETGLLPPVVQLVSNTSWSDEKTSDVNAPPSPMPEEQPAPTPQPVAAGCAGGCTAPCASCGQLAAGECCQCCGHCYRPVSLVAMAEATFLFPQFNRDFLAATFDNPLHSRDFLSNSELGSTDGALLVAPRITLGMQGEKWGFVGRYWNATNWANTATPTVPSDSGIGITNVDLFRAYTADLEVQRRFCPGAWNAYSFFGVRYASLNNDRHLNVASLGGLQSGLGDTLTTALTSQQFTGTGITFGFWGFRPVCCGSPLSVFISNRYSTIWGNGTAISQTMAMAGLQGMSTDGAIAKNRGDMFIAELMLGLQWNAQLRCVPGTAFARAAIEYQYWDTDAGVRTGSNSFVIGTNSAASTSASAGDMLVNLFGFTLGAGIMF